MGLEVTGIDTIAYLLRRSGDKGTRNLTKQMEEEAKSIAELGRKMAPVDEGWLEDAIDYERGPTRNSRGQFVTVSFIIGIKGQNYAGISREGKQTTVDDYAWIMHEHLAPFGPFKLGKRSLAKQAGNPSIMVGGKFLERAAAEIEKGLINRMIEALDDALDDFD